MTLKITTLIAFTVLINGRTSYAGSTYPDLMDQAIYTTYSGGSYFFQAQCSICHGNRPETAANATTDFASNFTFIGNNLLAGRGNLSNLTLTEMSTIVRAMAGYDPDSDGWTNEEEFGWDQENRRFINPSNPNDYFSTPLNAPPPGGGGNGNSGQSGEGSPAAATARMGGCGAVEAAHQPESSNAAMAWWMLLMPISLVIYRRKQ